MKLVAALAEEDRQDHPAHSQGDAEDGLARQPLAEHNKAEERGQSVR